MQDGEDVRAHLERFIDAVDKLKQLELEINDELLTMLLSSLPPEYDNFRCAIESRDELPKLEALRIKIIEETEQRKGKNTGKSGNALFTKKKDKTPNKDKNKNNEEQPEIPFEM
jgi:gag-polypeptide of LTR copia-type